VILAAFTRHVEALVPSGVEARVEAAQGAVPAYSIAADHRAVAAAVAALRTVYPGREPLLVRAGGTLPAAALFEQILGLKTLLFSFSISDENLHAPNEFFRLERLDEGMRAWAELWRRLAEELPAGAVRE
jgi:acetylornithine deacetylase/succinyl-diaminopimelate desuccinylase-like protein